MRRRDKSDRTKKFMVLFIAFLMFGSVFSIIFLGFHTGTSGQTNSIEYNGLTFTLRNNIWTTTYEDVPLSFVYLPTDLELIIFDDDVVPLLSNAAEIDVTSDFNDTFAEGIALSQYQMNLVMQPYNVYIRQGFTTPGNNFPVITCEDATQAVPVIYFKSANFTKVSLDGNCVIAEASTIQDTVRLKDRIIYGMLGIMK